MSPFLLVILMAVTGFANELFPSRSGDPLSDYRWMEEKIAAGDPASGAVFQPGIDRESRNTWGVLADIEGANVVDLAACAAFPEVVYASTYGGGVYKSTDGGLNWNKTTFINYLCTSGGLAVHPANPDIVYVSSYQSGHFDHGTFRSTDGGETWDPWGPAGMITARRISVHPIHPDTIYIAGYGDSYTTLSFFTDDAGVSWTQNYPLSAYALYTHPVDHDTTYYFGSTEIIEWATHGSPAFNQISLGNYYGTVNAMAIDPVNTENMYVASRSGLLISRNEGETWELRDTEFGADPDYPYATMPYVETVELDPASAEHLVISARSGLFESFDSGDTWDMIHQPIPGGTVNDIRFVDSSGGFQAATWWGGMWYFDGSSWTSNSSGLNHSYLPALQIETSEDIWVAGPGQGILKSEDGGLSWEAMNNGLGSYACYSLQINPSNPEIILSSFRDDGLYRSTNRGVSWLKVAGGEQTVRDIQFARSNPNTVFAHGYGYDDNVYANNFYRSEDGGLSWNTIYSSNHSLFNFTIDPEDENHLFIGSRTYEPGTGYVNFTQESFDGGISWPVSDTLFIGSYIKEFLFLPNTTRLLAATWGSGLFEMINNEWIPIGAGLPENAYLGDIELSPTDELYVSTWGAGVFTSLDSGLTWFSDNDGVESTGVINVSSRSTDAGVFTLASTYLGLYSKALNTEALLSITPDTLNFGNIYTSFPDMQTVNLRNIGSNTLEISSIQLADSYFELSELPALPLSLELNESYNLSIIADFTSEGQYGDQLIIISNSSSGDSSSLEINAMVSNPPVLEVNPDSIYTALFVGDSTSQILSLSNTGNSDLEFQILVSTPDPDLQNSPSPFIPYRPYPWPSLVEDPALMYPEAISVYSREEQENWIHLFHDVNEDLTTFDIKDVYLSWHENELRFKIDSYTSPNDSYFYTFFVALDTDQDISTGVSFDQENGYGWELGIDYIVSVFANTAIVAQYSEAQEDWVIVGSSTVLESPPSSSELIIGIPYDLIGAPEAFNCAFEMDTDSGEDQVPDIQSGHITVHRAFWVSLDVNSGTIAPNSQVDINISSNAEHLFGGHYSTVLNIWSNDPVTPIMTIPALLEVTGVPEYEGPDSLDFGEIFAGYPDSIEFLINNPGTDTLILFEIAIDQNELIFPYSELHIAPMRSQSYWLKILSENTGLLEANLSFLTNDLEHPEVSIPVLATGVLSPVISLSQESFVVITDQDSLVSQQLMISNSGGSDLVFDIAITGSDTSTHNRLIIHRGEANVNTPSSLQDIYPEAWQLLHEDPDEEELTVDIQYLHSQSTAEELFLRFSAYEPWDSPRYNIFAILYLDTDQDINTGLQRYDDLGVDMAIFFTWDMFSADGVYSWDENTFNFVFLDTLTTIDAPPDTNIFHIGVDRSIFNTNYAMNMRVVSGSLYENSDYIPDLDLSSLVFPLPWYWLNIDPDQGVVAPGEVEIITLSFDAGNLPEDTYLASVNINSNDPENRLSTMAISLTVQEPTGIEAPRVPTSFALLPNYPNPFNASTVIKYGIPIRTDVALTIFDIRGREIVRFSEADQTAGWYTLSWNGRKSDGSPIGSGLYFAKLEAGPYTQVIKLVLAK